MEYSLPKTLPLAYSNVRIRKSYLIALRRTNECIEETGKVLFLRGQNDDMGCTPKQAVKSTGRWKTRDAYIRLLGKEHHVVWAGEESMLQNIQAGISGDFKGDKMKAGLCSN